ncbi:Ohr family peroxiredoxin [Streptomyces sp. NPDC002920]
MSDVKPLYTARALATGDGRQGHVVSGEGAVDTDLAMPKEMGGAGSLPNPEIFFAAGFAACFHNALRLVARRAKHDVEGSSVSSAVTLGANDRGGFELTVRLEVSVPALDVATTEDLIRITEQVCPYSNAVRGNVHVQITVAA